MQLPPPSVSLSLPPSCIPRLSLFPSTYLSLSLSPPPGGFQRDFEPADTMVCCIDLGLDRPHTQAQHTTQHTTPHHTPLHQAPNIQHSTLQRKSHLCIPVLGIALPRSQFPHSCVCERFIYSQDRCSYFPAAEWQTDPGNIYHRYMSVGTGGQNIIFLFWK